MSPLERPADILARLMRLFRFSGSDMAERSAAMGPLFALNRNFISNLRVSGAIPSLHHLYAISELLHLRLGSVFEIFGIDLDLLLSLEAVLNANRTRLIETCPFGRNTTVSVPAVLEPEVALKSNAFLHQLVSRWQEVPLLTIREAAWRDHRYRYGKLGLHDTNAAPDIPSGAFFQMRMLEPEDIHRLTPSAYYFVQHPWGYTVCRCVYQNGFLLLHSNNPSFLGPHRLRYGEHALILGRVTAFAASLPTVRYQKDVSLTEKMPLPRAIAPWEHPSIQSLFATERRRRGMTRDEIDSAGERLAHALGITITGKYARNIELSERFPHTTTALGLAVIYSIRLADLFRSCGIILNNPGKFDLEQLLGVRQLDELPEWPISAPAPEPRRLWSDLGEEWHEWPLLLSRLNPDPRSTPDEVLRLYQSHYFPGLDPLIRPGSLLAIDSAKTQIAPAITTHNGHDSDWARRLYVVRHNEHPLRYYCGYLEATRHTVLLRSHPRAGAAPVNPFPRSAVTVIGVVTGIASHF